MIRTEMMEEVRQWLEDNSWDITLDEVLEAGWIDEEDNETEFTAEEADQIEMMFIDHEDEEEARRAEEAAEEEENFRAWQKELRYQEAEYRAMVA